MMDHEEALLAASFPDTYLTFYLRDHIYGIEARCLWEISTSTTLSPLPRTPARLVGITQLHGKIIPVVDLCSLLGLPFPDPGEEGGFIAVKPPGLNSPAGFYVTGVLGFEKFPEAEIIPLPPGSGDDSRKGLAGPPDRPVELLEICKLLEGVRKALSAGNKADLVLPVSQNKKSL